MSSESAKPLRMETPGQVWDSTILEQITTGGGLHNFAVHEQLADGSWRDEVVSSFPDPSGKGIFVPMKNPLWPLPGEPIDYGSEQELFDEIVRFWKHHHELRDSRSYDVLASFVLLTWRIEEFNVVPYVDFLGPRGTGKTRGLELLQQVAYRGWLVTHPTSAVAFYVVDHYGPTLLADNYEFWPRETRRDLDGLFNAGYRRGTVVPRRPREGEGNGPELLVYKVFDPKALAGTREPVDSLASRCIMIRCARNQGEKPIEVDAQWGKMLRSKLLSYRFRHLEKAEEAPLLEVMNRYGRVGEIFLAPLAVAPSDEIRGRLADFQLGVFEDQTEEEATSWEADVVKAILESSDLAIDLRLPVRAITDAFNKARDPQGLHPEDWVSPDKIGWILNRLGFRKARMSKGGNRAIRLDSELVDRLSRVYDVTTGTDSHTPTEASKSQSVKVEGELDKFTAPVSDTFDTLTPRIGDGDNDGSDATPELTQELVQSVLATFIKLEKESENGEIDEEFLVRKITNDEHDHS